MAVAAAYRNPDTPLERVLSEVWRAARSEPDSDIRDHLSSDGVQVCLAAALESQSPAAAAERTTRELAEHQAGSLAAEIGKRAAVLSARHEDRLPAFITYLFEQMTDYLVSRDLPGYIGERWRNKTVADAIRFKDQLRQQTAVTVRELNISETPVQAGAWRDLVGLLVERLAR